MNKKTKKMLKYIEQYERYENQFLDKENTTDDLLEWILAGYIDEYIDKNEKSSFGSVCRVIKRFAK